jgi:hypothetical protein
MRMKDSMTLTKMHPTENDLADFLSKSLSKAAADRVRSHISRCDECLAAAVSSYEASASGGSPSGNGGPAGRIKAIMKRLNIYLALAIISFILSFAVPRYFVQLLVATLLLGVKWVADSKSAKMLVMIYEAWKHGGEKEASRVLERIGQNTVGKPLF